MTNYTHHLYPLTNDISALVVMAADLEYGEQLKALGVRPLITGVGPVLAAISLTHALSELSRTRMPDIVLNIGSAGSAVLEQGTVYRVSRSNYRDMDASAFGFPRGATPFSPYPETIELPALPGSFPSASCSTGANVVSDHSGTDADMSDMEYSALCEAGMRFGIPVIGFKGISDGKTPLTGKLIEWTALLPLIDRNLASAITWLTQELIRKNITRADLCRMPACWSDEHALRRTVAA